MFKLESQDALLTAFRPKDRKRVEVPRDLALPRFVRDYLAWTHPSGACVYLVFAVKGGAPTGIVFDSNGGGAEPLSPAMCDWCHCTGKGTEVGLLTAQVNRNKRAGVHVCTDLGCREKLEDECNRIGRSVLPAMEKLLERMGRFAAEALQMDLTGARR